MAELTDLTTVVLTVEELAVKTVVRMIVKRVV